MLRLYPPGTRKGNRFYVAKGYVLGREYEVVCRDAHGSPTADARVARQFARSFANRVKEDRDQHAARSAMRTWGEVADAYIAARGSSRNEQNYIEKLKAAWIDSAGMRFGDILIGDVLPMHISAAANALYEKCTNETKNRHAYTPAAAVLHFAAENRLRDYIVVKKLPEKKPQTRRPAPGTARKLLAKTTGDEHLFLLAIFCQGWRITETLSLLEDKIDLHERSFELFVNKARTWQRLHMHDLMFEELANRLPIGRADGRVFPWRDRHEVYDWLTPLCNRLGVVFTPHMARHEFASALRSIGAHPRDLVDAGSWTSEKSTARYDQVPERAKDLMNKFKPSAKTRGRSRGRRSKG